MKKLKNLLFVLFVVCTAVLLASCDATANFKVEFKQEQIQLQPGEEIDIADYIKLEVAQMKDVSFVSSNSGVAYVSPQNILHAIKNGRAIIEAKAGDSRSYLTVVVDSPLPQFESITNLRFDNNQNKVMWNHAYVVVNAKPIKASLYTLTIEKDGQTTTQTTTNNYFELSTPGSYKVSVAASAENYDLSEIAQIEFRVIATPTGVTYNKQTSTLSWQSVENATYEVTYDTLTVTTQNTSIVLPFEQAGEHTVSVRAVIGQDKSKPSQTISLTRLNNPAVTIDQGVLHFDLTQVSLTSKYQIKVENSFGETTTIDNYTGSYVLEGFTSGEYYLQVRAIANSDLVLDSLNPQTYTVNKLYSPTINFDPITRTISVSEQNSTIVIVNTNTLQEEKVVLANSSSHVLDKITGEYEIYAFFGPRENNQIQSDKSNSVFVKVLSPITQIRHISTENTSQIWFKQVYGAEGYKVFINGIEQGDFKQAIFENDLAMHTLSLPTNQLFATAGEYVVQIEAYDTTFTGTEHYLITNNADNSKLSVVRLATPQPVYDQTEKTVSWQNVEEAIKYSVSLFKDQVIENTWQISENVRNLQDLTFGNYLIAVLALGDGQYFLDSLEAGQVEFSVKQKLQTPTFAFDRQTQELIVGEVEHAEAYSILLNDTEWKTTQQAGRIFIGDLLENAGQYVFELFVYSVSNSADNGDGNLFASDKANVTIEKLPIIQQIEVTNQNEVLVDFSEFEQQKLASIPVLIKINDQIIEQFNQLEFGDEQNFVVEIKLLANTNSTNPYYLDSDYSTFTFTRFDTPQQLQYNQQTISWQSVEGAQDYLLVFEVQENKYQVEVDTNSIDVSSLQTQTFYQSMMENGFAVSVKVLVKDIIVQNGQSAKISSLLSLKYTVGVLEQTQIEQVMFDDEIEQNIITIVWAQVNLASGYGLSINGVETTVLINNYQFGNTANQYEIKIWAISAAHLPAKQITFTLIKVASPNDFVVSENEKLSVVNLPENAVDVLFDKQQKENSNFDLSTIANTAQVNVMFVGSGMAQDVFYLNSNQVVLSFERLSKVENVKIENNTIEWDVQPLADQYEVIITNIENQTQTIRLQAKINLVYVHSLPLDAQEILNFTHQSGLYSVSVRALINQYSLSAPDNLFGLLSSEQSDSVDFGKLETPQNVQILAEDTPEQLNVTISWQSVENATSYQVFANDQLIGESNTNQYVTDVLTYNNPIAQNGMFNIQVVALAENFVASNVSQATSVQRLANVATQFITVTENGVLMWQGVSNNNGYAVYYKKSGDEQSSEVFTTSTVLYSFENQLTQDNFSGPVDFYVLAKGNGTTTLSGAYSKVTKIRLDAPEVEIGGTYIKVFPSILSNSAKFKVTVKFDTGDQVLTLQTFHPQPSEQFNLPEVWMYQGTPITQQGEFVFEVVAFEDDFITSQVTQKRVEKLQAPTFLGFTLLDGPERKIILSASVGAMATNSSVAYTLAIENTTYTNTTAIPNEDGELVFEVMGDLDWYINVGAFNISLKAQLEGYLDSSKAFISGYRLSPVTTMMASQGVLTWELNTQTQVSGYLLRVLHSDDVVEYFNKTPFESFDALQGISGSIIANIKTLGNLQVGQPTKDNIILDSSYILEGIVFGHTYISEKNYTFTKLATPAQFKVDRGQFAIMAVDEATEYVVKDQSGRIFSLQTSIAEDGFAYGLSQAFYSGVNKLSLNTTYEMAVRAISDQPDVLYSDYTDALKIRILPNPNTVAEDFTFEWSPAHVDDIKISWKPSPISDEYYFEVLAVGVDGRYPYQMFSSGIVKGLTSVMLNADIFDISGFYVFRLKVIGQSTPTPEEYYYLTSEVSPEFEFSKLKSPNISVEDGKLVWNAVEGANGYYIYYIVKTGNEQMDLKTFIGSYTQHPNMVNKIYWQMPDSFGQLSNNVEYYLGVRAVNTANELKTAPSALSVLYEFDLSEPDEEPQETQDPEDEEEQVLETLRPVTKLKAPSDFKLINGKLVWKQAGLDYNYSINLFPLKVTFNAGTQPFVYTNDIEALQDIIVNIKMTTPTGESRIYPVQAINFFHANVVDTSYFEIAAAMFGIDPNFEFGWPVKDWFTDEIGSTVVPGLQHVSVSQKGNDYDWLDSMYSPGFDIYIPHKPTVRIASYVLSWDSVPLPVSTYPHGAAKKYSVIAEDSSGVRTIIHQTNDLSVDLRDLVNSDKLLSGKHRLYVLVNGDSSVYLNGLPSDPIQIEVLPSVNASFEKGMLNWASISLAQDYNIVLDPNNINYRFEQIMQQGPWDFDQIATTDSLGQILTYNLTIQALGNGTTIISGKVTNLGQVIKLDTPSMEIEQGVFKWDNVANNLGYFMLVTDENGKVTTVELTKDKTMYESSITGFNNYNLKAIGTTYGPLKSNSVSYALSSKSENGINAVMLPSVTEARAHQGNLVWTNVREFNNIPVSGYKITFDDINFYDAVFVTDFTPVIINDKSFVMHTIDSTYLAGTYKVYIQPYSENDYYRTQDGKRYKYLLGAITPDSEIEFIKMRNVSNISAHDGVIVWDSNDSLSSNYKVTFIRGAQKVEFTTHTNKFDPAQLNSSDIAKYATITVGEPYSVKVQTLGNNFDLISSDEIESLGYKKLPTIQTVQYRVDDQGNEGFVIRWLFTEYFGEITDYHYLIRYNNSGSIQYQVLDSRTSSAIRRGYSESDDAYYGEIDGSSLMNDSTEQLKFSIAIVPITTAYVLTSDFSAERSLTPPRSLSGEFTYNAAARKISWQYDAGGSEVSFRIIDEIVEMDEQNNIIVLQTKIYTSQVSEFIPEVIGLHRISISVMLTGEQVASSYAYFYLPISQAGIVNNQAFVVDNAGEEQPFSLLNFDLFASGDGSSANPYIIETPQHFMAINQRLTKPAYLGGESKFNFKQTQPLNMILSQTIGEFGGVYDGNRLVITWQTTNISNTKVGLFTSIEPGAVVKNVIINAKIIQQEDLIISTLYMSALAADNYGTIENSQIVSFTFETTISRGIDYYYGSFASVNYGLITKSINTANITFDGGTNQASVRNSRLYVGGIAYSNAKGSKAGENYVGTIYQAGNMGNIKVIANTVTIGGVAATTNPEATVEQAFNKGWIDATLSASAAVYNYIGGLVGNSQGKIKNSYNVAPSISLNVSGYNRTAYVGGIAGYISNMNGALISNNYTSTTTFNITNSTLANVQLGLILGFANAPSRPEQTTTYYRSATGIAAVNGTEGFSLATAQFGTYTSLLTNLNNTDYVFASGSQHVVLEWENSFAII